jgi:energy-coupling factor transport system ATP-binding protein
VFKLNNVTYTYPNSKQPALEGVNLEIESGEFILVLGKSGSGKSTMSRMLCRLIPDFFGGCVKGQIMYKGKRLQDWNSGELCREISIVFQDPATQLVYSTVERDIAFGMENLGYDQARMRRRMAEVFDALGLTELKERSVDQLSGGEKQKIALAGALTLNPSVLILDEPTAHLDPVSAQDFINMVKRVNEDKGITIIMSEQRLDNIIHLCDRVLCLDKGRLVFNGTPAAQNRYTFLSRANAFASQCIECGKCEGHCPQGIRIREELKKVAELFE